MEHRNPNENGYRDNYTNFDQFLNQYNMASNTNDIQYLPYDYQTSGSETYGYGYSNEINNFQVENSNLLPTAAEFVPRWQDQKYQEQKEPIPSLVTYEVPNDIRSYEYYNGNLDQLSYDNGSQLEFANLGASEININANTNKNVSTEKNKNQQQQQHQQNRGSTGKWGSHSNKFNQIQTNKNNLGQKNYNNRSDGQRSSSSVVYERGRNRYEDESQASNNRRRHNRYDERSQQQQQQPQQGNGGGGGAASSSVGGRYRNEDRSNGKWDSDRNYRNNYKDSRNYDRNEWRSATHDDNNEQKYNKESTARNFNLTTKNHSEYKTDTKNLKTETKIDDEKFTQREKLSREIDGGNLECLVCCENIKPFQSTWSCNNCFHIIHLNCTIKWAASSKSDEGWRCPACQNVTKRIPKDYYCFCGKTKNPHYNRNDMAHTCGELCERMDGCIHPCTQLCHPGPCPPCQTTVTRYCGCNKTSRIMQCNQKIDVKCDLTCDKLLNCNLHQCIEKCHQNACTDCEKKVQHKCYCGKEEKNVDCNTENNNNLLYSCNKVCNKLLSCKNHNCTRICHSDDCGECKLSITNITSCPCGKIPIIKGQRLTCLDPIPLCGGICKRILKCGPSGQPHSCASRCHLGNCPPCNKETGIKCRCGLMDQMIKCRQLQTRADDARCKKRCTKKRNCGKHKCNQECCIDVDHICPMPCTFTLSCGKHKCDQTCHKGRCIPCYRTSFEELYCECGAEVIYPPVPCGTKRPECNKPCSRRHNCNHEVLHNCHNQTSCPPCMILSTIPCHGKHETRKTIPCSQGEFSCGLPCNKPLDCKRHKCIKPCHSGICMNENEICKQNCTKIRISCSHKCNAPCHNDDCPDIPCKESVEVTCQCGNRKQTRSCHDFASDYRRIATSQLASSMQEMQRGNSVELSDILGPIKINNNKTLDCNDDCKTLERNRRLAIGLQIRNPDLSSKLQPRYSDFLRGWAKKDAIFVQNIHDKLTELVKLAKESKQRSRSHSFPTMNREKRQVVHEMCGMFGVDSIAYDAEPNRNVVATAYKEKTWMPSMSLSEVLKREVGQRRIPVPNMNAWGMKR